MPEEAVGGQRIDSWKEIATYLGRDIRTVIRWEKDRGLPVRRVPGGQRQAVFAYRHELDAWLKGPSQITETQLEISARDRALAPAAPTATTGSPAEVGSTEAREAVRTSSRRPVVIYAVWGALATVLIAGSGYFYWNYRATTQIPVVASQKEMTQNGQEKQGLLTDGKTLYFAQEQDGRFALVSMPVEGGPIRVLWTPPANVLPIDVSADGDHLLALTKAGVEMDGQLWLVPLHGGSPWRVGEALAHSACLSPDGKTVAYSPGTKILLSATDGTALRMIGSYSATPYALHWSEDGKRLQFVLQDTSLRRSAFWELVSEDGMRTSTLRSFPSAFDWGTHAWIRGPVPDSYFVTGTAPDRNQLLLVEQRTDRLDRPLKVSEMHLGWTGISEFAYSRETHQLFSLNESRTRAAFERFDVRTQSFRPILPGIGGIYLDFSKNGQMAAVVSGADSSLWVVGNTGLNPRQLTFPPEHAELPRWSPDGREIAYSTKLPDGPQRIYIVQVDSGEKREASEGNDSQGAPTWSPDGRFLVYGGVHCEETRTCAIHRIDLETGRIQTLPGSEGLWTARWSPDGQWIAAIRVETHELLIYNLKQDKWTKLAEGMNGTDMDWSRDSKYIYANLPGAEAGIIRIRLTDGRRETLLNLRSQDKFDLANIAEDLGFSLAPDDSIILRRRIHAAEIYAYELR